MKHRLHYSLLLLLSMFFSLSSQAQTLIDGIYYDLNTGTHTASVTSGSVKYSGEIIIPSSVERNGTEYSVTSIGYRAFFDCTSLSSVEIPSSVTSIGYEAFNYCTSLTSITVDPDNATYDSRDNCNAVIRKSDNTLIFGCQSTTIPSSVTSIGYEAFLGCTSLTSINIPSSVTSIGGFAFYGCTSLTSIEIPSSITSIGQEAFGFCTSLTSVVCEAVTPPTCDIGVFDYVPQESAKLYVPEASIGAYRTTSPWSTFGSILPLSDFDTKIEAVEENADRGASAHAVYSLSGQRTVQPGRGIYITNGKVFIAK